MADFKTHMTVSTGLGIAYGTIGYTQFQIPLGSCLIAGGLCSLSGMLPDLDSDSGIPVRETLAFTSAVIPLLMMERFERIGMSHASMVVAGGLTYFFLRFVAWEVFKRYTKHRGMWHSIPAAVIAALIAFLISSSQDISLRMFRSWAVFLGFMSHLAMDELYSVDLNGRLVKKSFGTAMKFFGKNRWANITTYAKLVALALIVVNDPMVQTSLEQEQIALPGFARKTIEVLQVKSVKEWIPHDHRTHEDFDQKTLLPIRRGPLTRRRDTDEEEPTMVVRWLNYLTGSTQEELHQEVQQASFAESPAAEDPAVNTSNLLTPASPSDNNAPIGNSLGSPFPGTVPAGNTPGVPFPGNTRTASPFPNSPGF